MPTWVLHYAIRPIRSRVSCEVDVETKLFNHQWAIHVCEKKLMVKKKMIDNEPAWVFKFFRQWTGVAYGSNHLEQLGKWVGLKGQI